MATKFTRETDPAYATGATLTPYRRQESRFMRRRGLRRTQPWLLVAALPGLVLVLLLGQIAIEPLMRRGTGETLTGAAKVAGVSPTQDAETFALALTIDTEEGTKTVTAPIDDALAASLSTGDRIAVAYRVDAGGAVRVVACGRVPLGQQGLVPPNERLREQD